METYPAAQTLGFFDAELRASGVGDVPLLEAKGNPLSRLDGSSMKGFYLRYIGRRRDAAANGLINLIYNLARYESRFRIGTAKARRLKSDD